jgi:hypothetical protein
MNTDWMEVGQVADTVIADAGIIEQSVTS